MRKFDDNNGMVNKAARRVKQGRKQRRNRAAHFLDNRVSELQILYQSNMPVRQIAQKMGVGQTTLCEKIKELGWTRTPRCKKKVVNERKLKELLKLGLSDVQICQKLHIGRYVLSKYKKQLGFYVKDEVRIAASKKAAACRAHYRKKGLRAECPNLTNVLEKYQDEIIPLLEQGTPKTEIAKRYGVCVATVFNFIHLYGIDAPIRKVCDHKEQLIRQAFNEGKTLKDIAKQVKCSPDTLWHKVQEMKLTRAGQAVINKIFLNDQTLYQQGLSGDEIAEKLHTTNQSIYRCIRRLNLTRPNKWAEYRSTFKGRDTELLQMRQQGMTLKQIGNYFGVKDNTVLYRLRKLEGANA